MTLTLNLKIKKQFCWCARPLLFDSGTTFELTPGLNAADEDWPPTLRSLLLVLKSAVCFKVAVIAVATTSWVVTDFPDAELLVTNTYWEEQENVKIKHTKDVQKPIVAKKTSLAVTNTLTKERK